ncbi:MAG: sulfur carrier protein ThiS [Acidobacteriota bacterium]
MITLRINGHETTVAEGTTLGAWLASADREPRMVAVERNGTIVPRTAFDTTVLQDGDQLEVVHFVQGG